MPKSPRPAAGAAPLSFVDAHGGAFSSLAAAIARASGRGDAIAATSSKAIAVPAEIAVVLDEIGMKTPEVVPAARLPRDARRVDVGAWGTELYAGEGELERLAVARIARDRIERRVEAMAEPAAG
jgi:hypothetical protein